MTENFDIEGYLNKILSMVDEKGMAFWGHFDLVSSREGEILWNARNLLRESEVIQVIHMWTKFGDKAPKREFAVRGKKWCEFQGYWRDHLIKETLKAAEEGHYTIEDKSG